MKAHGQCLLLSLLDIAQESDPFHVVRVVTDDGSEVWTVSFNACALFVSPERHGIQVPMDPTDLMLQMMAQQGTQTR